MAKLKTEKAPEELTENALEAVQGGGANFGSTTGEGPSTFLKGETKTGPMPDKFGSTTGEGPGTF